MRVVIRPYLFLREALGKGEITLHLPAGATVGDLLALLRREKGLPGLLNQAGGRLVLFEGDRPVGLSVLVDGRNIRQLNGLQTVLPEGAVVSLFPPAAGG